MTTNAGGQSLISRINEFQTVAKLFADSGMFRKVIVEGGPGKQSATLIFPNGGQ